ncbi:MAG TPA: DUF4826 family protein [Gemmata sp.]
MFDFLKRLFGGSGGAPNGTAKPIHARDGEPENSARREEWVATQQKRLREYFVAEALFAADIEIRPAWVLYPDVAVWAIPGGWAISGAVSFDYVVDQNDILRSPRDAARHFGRKLRTHARQLRTNSGSSGTGAEALTRQAEAILAAVRDDTGWPEDFPLDEATLAPGPTAWQRADRLLAGKLFKTETDPELAPVLRIVYRKLAAPGGPFFGLYFFLDASNPTPQLFDRIAHRLQEIETQFAPLVGHRVQYALVFFGINFGMRALELEACRQADLMRGRHPALSHSIDNYSARDAGVLPVHFVDDTGTPWTAHPCVVRDPNKPYTAEAEHFNCRDQPLHKSMEESPDVGLRLIAKSIAPDVIAEARRAFAG